jgi:hypothetical protein
MLKVYFSRLMRVFIGLLMLLASYLVQVSLLLIGQQGFVDFRYRPFCFPLAGGLCKFYTNAGGK